MKLNTLKLINFRNYDNLNIDFNESLNIIYGNNGSGKTNLVEAIYALSLTKSFRTNNDKNLIKKGELSTKIEGIVEKKDENNYQVIISKEGKKVKIDNDFQSHISDYISNISVILLEPDEQILLDETPSIRRKLLNIEISQLKKEYLLYLNDYNKILKQRNFYLREMLINGNSSRNYLNILTSKLIDYGIKIYEERCEFINNINDYIGSYYNKIISDGNMSLKYISDFSNKDKDELLKMYQKIYDKEINMGKTLKGIHHDDLIFLYNNENISEWGSNGQRKNAILAFKLSEIEVFKNIKNETPILILDDIFSAFDEEKVKNIVSIINNREVQTFITTTDIDNIDKSLLKNALLIKVENGNIEEAK